jgi:hypothetical protein
VTGPRGNCEFGNTELVKSNRGLLLFVEWNKYLIHVGAFGLVVGWVNAVIALTNEMGWNVNGGVTYSHDYNQKIKPSITRRRKLRRH